MDEDLIIDIVKSKLNQYKLDKYVDIKPQTRKQLGYIENYLQQCIAIYQNCVTEMSKVNLSVRGVCSNANVSKSTVYQNKDILFSYIEKRISEIDDKYDIFSSKKISSLETKNGLLERRLDNMIVDYIEMANLKAKLEELYKENEKLKKQKDALNLERVQLIGTNNQLSNELARYRNNIINLIDQNK